MAVHLSGGQKGSAQNVKAFDGRYSRKGTGCLKDLCALVVMANQIDRGLPKIGGASKTAHEDDELGFA
jgi:hypothetical protein